jgi:hypothetical protein
MRRSPRLPYIRVQVGAGRPLGDALVLHQCTHQHALLAPVLQLGNLRRDRPLAPIKHRSSHFGALNAVRLALGPQPCLVLGDGAEHVEE